MTLSRWCTSYQFVHKAAMDTASGYSAATRGRVELHIHLDGCIRPATVAEYAKKRGLPWASDSVEEIKKLVSCQGRGTLLQFLGKFSYLLPPIAGDAEAIKRVAYEFCEDAAKSHIMYVETRYCPHLLANKVQPRLNAPTEGDITARDVVRLIQEGLKKGSQDFNIQVRSILSCIACFKEWSDEMVDLCVEFRDSGVVGIDIAGSEDGADEEKYSAGHVNAFKRAKELGIHRTAHAGEDGPPDTVQHAVEEMFAERIGHGYHVVQDEVLYKNLQQRNMHFECCPISSWFTGSAPEDLSLHPIHRFIKDNINISINTDDPTVCSNTLSDDYTWCLDKFGMTEADLIRSNFRAAQASFLPEKEKEDLISRLKEAYKGVDY